MAKSICFLVDSIFSIGGVQRVTAVIAQALSKEYDVTIVTLDDPSTKDTSIYGLDSCDIHFRFFHYPGIGKWKLTCCKAYSWLYRKVLPKTRWTSDIYARSSFPSERRRALVGELQQKPYHAIIGDHAPLAVRLAACKGQLKGSLLIGWIHNSYDALYGEGSRYIGPELQKHYEYQLAKLHHTIVLCHCDAQRYHIPTEVIYNPLTLTPGARSQGTSRRFLTVGRFTPLHKGIDLLIEAFRLFAQVDKEWMLDIVGEGPEGERYQKMVEDYQLQDRICFHPFTNDIRHYYSQAQVYVLSSRWEGMPLVLMEAMSHGLPIVASDLPVCQEVMETFGIYFHNGDIQDLARQLSAATKTDWQEKSDQAVAIAERYSIGNIIRQWKTILER